MINKRILGILLIAAVSLQAVYAQHLSIEDCRRLAIENNKALKIASEQERVAYYQKKDALTKYFPDLSLSGNYMRNQKNLKLINPGSIPSNINLPPIPGLPPSMDISPLRDKLLEATEVDIKNIWMAGINLTQPIFTGGKIIALNDIRSYAEDLAKTMKDTKTTDILVEVDNAYWQVVSIASKQKLANSYVELLTKMDRDIAIMQEEGVATKADRLSVSVKLNEAEMTQTKAQNGVSLSKMLLSQICGLDITDQIVLVDENTESLSMAIPAAIYSTDEALTNRSELKSLALASKIYDKQIVIARAEFLPTVGLSANYMWMNPSSYNGFEKKMKGMWSVGVGVKVPLNIMSSSAKLGAAKAEAKIKKYELQEAQEKIMLQVNQEAYKLTEASKKLTSAMKNSEKADENLRYATVGFEEGVISAADAMAAHTAWIAAHSEKIDAQIDLKLCTIYLNKALGRRL